jgi:hypothetical protein
MIYSPLEFDLLHDAEGTRLRARTGTIAIEGSLDPEQCDRLSQRFQQEALRQRRERNRIPSPTHYDLLGLARTATADQIQAAYRTRAKEFHPDTSATDSTIEMQRLNSAYAVLGDPPQRQRYDTTLN